MPVRNAASVLPEPVGACTSTCAPLAITGQAASCAGVGAGERTLEPGARWRAEAGECVHPGQGIPSGAAGEGPARTTGCSRTRASDGRSA